MMKTPSRFLPAILLSTAVLFASSSLVYAADEEKHDAGPAPSAEELKAVEALSKGGARADQIANGINWRYVNFRGVEKPDPALYGQLKSIPSVVELNLSGMQFTPDELANISGLQNLTILNLSKTNVTDDELAAVEKLDKLESLNLFSTGVTDAGLSHLSGLKKLHRLYLAETKVTDAGVDTLKKALPEMKINRGPEFTPPAPPATPAPKPEEAKAAPPAPKPEEKKPEEKKADSAPSTPKAEEKKADAPPAPKPEDKKPDAAK
jgi:hypothetical protein